MQGWSSRPLQGVYAAVFIDAIYVKVRDGQVGNQPFYAAIGVDLAGHRDVLGPVGRARRRGVGEVLDERAHRPEEPGRHGRLLRRLRRPQGPAGRGHRRLPEGDRAGVRDPPDPGHPALRVPQVLGPAREGPASGLHRAQRRGGLGGVRGARGEMGQALPGDPASCGGRRGRSSLRSSRTTWRSGESSSPPTRSSPSTPATGVPWERGGTSRPSRPHSSACTWSRVGWTPRVWGRHDGSPGGSRH